MALITGIIYIRRTNELQKTCKNKPNEEKKNAILCLPVTKTRF